MLGVMLARLGRVVVGMGGMAMRRLGVVRGLFVRVGVVMLGSLAVMLGGVLVMLRGGGVMFDDLVFGHDALRASERRSLLRRRIDSRKDVLHGREPPPQSL
jgi:hypothetical protein